MGVMTPEDFLAAHSPAMLVEITATKGSAPREAETLMLVGMGDSWGTIGGGQLEFLAIDHARRLLAAGKDGESLDIPLGPEIGQCCGGRVELGFKLAEGAVMEGLLARLAAERDSRPQVWLFGAGHVGKALARALALLPLSVFVVESREDELNGLAEGVASHLAAMPEALVAGIRPGAAVIILTHDHALDFLIAREALARHDLAYIGMIGSKTKRATFEHQFLREGGSPTDLSRLTLPIGGHAVRDKRPEVIAAMTVAEVLAALAGHQGQI